MPKIPYIKFYPGDYIKDTRVLPLNVKGGWVDIILAMAENDPPGELTGTVEDFARIMSCDQNEAFLVIQTLIQKKTCDFEMVNETTYRLISRKQKKDARTSEIRKNTGKLGGNPILVKQKDNPDLNGTSKNLVNQNPEYEYEYIVGSKEGVQGEIRKWNFRPGEKEMDLDLPEIKSGAACQMFYYQHHKKLSPDEMNGYWTIFKQQNFTGDKPYPTPNDTFSHFINWIKLQKPANGADNPTASKSSKSAGAYALANQIAGIDPSKSR